MMRNQMMEGWHSAEQCLLGGMVLALTAAAGIWLVLGPAPTTDPTLQGDAFFVLIGAEPPPAGTALRATIVRAAALDGVAVPRAAIVWSAGKPAVYVERDAGTFERRSLALAAALPGAWLVTDGVAAGERVVATGAGQLLSAQTLTPKAE